VVRRVTGTSRADEDDNTAWNRRQKKNKCSLKKEVRRKSKNERFLKANRRVRMHQIKMDRL